MQLSNTLLCNARDFQASTLSLWLYQGPTDAGGE